MLNYTAVRCCTTELVAELSSSFRSVPSELKCQGTSVVYSMRALGQKSNCSRCCLLERSCISSRGGAGKTSPFRWVASHFLKAISTRPPHHLTTSYNILQHLTTSYNHPKTTMPIPTMSYCVCIWIFALQDCFSSESKHWAELLGLDPNVIL